MSHCKTLEEAMHLILSTLTKEELDQIRDMDEEDLILLHLGFWERIRNELGLCARQK